MSRSIRFVSRATLLALTASLLATVSASAFNPDTRVTSGSPTMPFSQNKQNEPAVAINPVHTNILVAGANDNIDMEACNAGPDTDCPFTEGVGVSGVSISVDSGDTWDAADLHRPERAHLPGRDRPGSRLHADHRPDRHAAALTAA